MGKIAESRLEQIFDATLRLTGKVGIAGLKMSNIAKEASMATGTLYIYFKNKEELLNALYIRLTKEGALAIVQQINHLPVNIQLYKMWRAALESMISNSHRMIFLEQFLISPYISENNKKIDTSFRNYLKNLLDNGKKEKSIKGVDNDILISLIIGFVRNFSSYLVNEKNGELTDKSVDESFSLCWEAIKR